MDRLDSGQRSQEDAMKPLKTRAIDVLCAVSLIVGAVDALSVIGGFGFGPGLEGEIS